MKLEKEEKYTKLRWLLIKVMATFFPLTQFFEFTSRSSQNKNVCIHVCIHTHIHFSPFALGTFLCKAVIMKCLTPTRYFTNMDFNLCCKASLFYKWGHWGSEMGAITIPECKQQSWHVNSDSTDNKSWCFFP